MNFLRKRLDFEQLLAQKEDYLELPEVLIELEDRVLCEKLRIKNVKWFMKFLKAPFNIRLLEDPYYCIQVTASPSPMEDFATLLLLSYLLDVIF
ncbi:hypothetical protein HI914_03878 [Erysiphe necator]|nr:hypothetical protein HI914_03878 [Erysiphe necator]